MAEPRTHKLARCCWCGSAFVWSKVKGTDVWLCPSEGCWRRQVSRALAVSVKGGAEKVLRVPLPRQVELEEATGRARRVLIGGAAGGSKSDGIRWLLYKECLRTPGFKALLVRRTFKDLERTHMREAEGDAGLFGAVFLKADKLVKFPNGSVLEFGHCEDAGAVQNYLSAEYDAIGFDELVTFERDMFLMIASRARTRKVGVRPYVVAGTNPGGPQSAWVKAYFIDRSVDVVEFPNYRPEEYAFIPSRLEDNPYLNEDYEQGLLDLPPELRKAYRDGNWDIFPGQFFPEWNAKVHVSAQHVEYPKEYPRVCSVDWGFVNNGVCGWWVLLPDGGVYREAEYVFKRTVAAEVAQEIVRRSKARGIKVRYTVGDTGMWTPESQTGETIAETFGRYGVPMVQADKDRVNGWARMRHWFRPCPTGAPWMTTSPLCAYFIRTIPSLVSDDHNPEDVDSSGDDHAADECFVAGTQILTEHGERPIETVRVGDLVWTRDGLKPVLQARETGVRPVVSLHLPSGRILTGTANHPIWTAERGFVRMDDVRYCDMLMAWPDPTSLTVTATHVSAGARLTAPSPMAITSTTGTAIRAITRWRTWNAFRALITSPNTGAAASSPTLTGYAFSDLPPSGTGPMRDAHGTPSTRNSFGSLEPWGTRALRRAISAVQTLWTEAWTVAGAFVPTGARRSSVTGAGLITWNGRAWCAAAPFGSTDINAAAPVLAHVPVSSRPTPDEASHRTVFNLTVADSPEYVANGVLVHNCRYFFMSRPMPGRKAHTAVSKPGSWAWWKAEAGRGQAPKGILAGRR